MTGVDNWALLVIDLQNDFLDRHGYYAVRSRLEGQPAFARLSSADQARQIAAATGHEPGGLIAGSASAVAAALRAVTLADRARRPIAVVKAAYDRRFEVLPPRLASDPQRRHFPCVAGSWGAELIAPLVDALSHCTAATAATFDKHTYDAFHQPEPLCSFLARHAVETLVVCGTETQTCVLASAQHAALLGYRTWLLEDGVWSVNARLGAAALEIFRNAYGRSLSLAELQRWVA